jgi:hypothetical protein
MRGTVGIPPAVSPPLLGGLAHGPERRICCNRRCLGIRRGVADDRGGAGERRQDRAEEDPRQVHQSAAALCGGGSLSDRGHVPVPGKPAVPCRRQSAGSRSAAGRMVQRAGLLFRVHQLFDGLSVGSTSCAGFRRRWSHSRHCSTAALQSRPGREPNNRGGAWGPRRRRGQERTRGGEGKLVASSHPQRRACRSATQDDERAVRRAETGA